MIIFEKFVSSPFKIFVQGKLLRGWKQNEEEDQGWGGWGGRSAWGVLASSREKGQPGAC